MKARSHNWDHGYDDLYTILFDPYCDKGTALVMYWLSRPEWYTQYVRPNMVPSHEKEGYEFIKQIEAHYPEIDKCLIIYDPKEDQETGLYKDSIKVVSPLPKIMYEKTKGEIHFKTIKIE